MPIIQPLSHGLVRPEFGARNVSLRAFSILPPQSAHPYALGISPGHLLDPRPTVRSVVNLSPAFIFPIPPIPMIPVCHLRNPKPFCICPNFISVFGRKVLDLGWLAIDFRIKVRNLLAGWPERDDGVVGVFDGLRVRDGKAIQDMPNVIHGADLIRVSVRTLWKEVRIGNHSRNGELVGHLLLVRPHDVLLQDTADETDQEILWLALAFRL